jgi:hypothetical protein
MSGGTQERECGECLTPEEFLARMKVGRTTLFKWMGDGTLVRDVDFIKMNRVVRFAWPPVCLAKLETQRELFLRKQAEAGDNMSPRSDEPLPAAAGEKGRRVRGRRAKTDIDAYILDKTTRPPNGGARRRPNHERRAS